MTERTYMHTLFSWYEHANNINLPKTDIHRYQCTDAYTYIHNVLLKYSGTFIFFWLNVELDKINLPIQTYISVHAHT